MRWPDPERLATLYAALVVASVGIALAGLTWRLAGYADTPVAVPPGPVDPPSRRVAANLTPITALAPFGRPDPSAAPPTRLAIELRGAVLARPEAASSAWIAAANGPVRSYRIGETVASGATLKSVAVDHVLLNVSGQVERLDSPRRKAAPEGQN
jgi:general secretion pathway protein C